MQTKMAKGSLVVISGFSGAGKGRVMRSLLEHHEEYGLSVSVTTREPRWGEEDGREYFFRTRKEFERMIEEGELLEYASYVENYYGTPLPYVREQLEAGRNVILEIECQGAFQVRERFPEALLIFVTPPSIAELENRLRGRGTETEEEIRGRLRRAAEEVRLIPEYDYLVVNENNMVDECAERIHNIVESAKDRTGRNTAFVSTLQEEAAVYGQKDSIE